MIRPRNEKWMVEFFLSLTLHVLAKFCLANPGQHHDNTRHVTHQRTAARVVRRRHHPAGRTNEFR